MSEVEEAPETAVAAPNPDAQTTVNDFLDYTEFLPSDVQRSLTLIADLDASCRAAVQHVHDTAALYGSLPSRSAVAGQLLPDPVTLRRQIARHLQRALDQRAYAYAEATRLHEVALRHCQRATVIRKKLQSQPEPPSRDPTPAPASPAAHRPPARSYERSPHLRLTFDAARHAANSSRPRARPRKTAPSAPRARFRRHSASSGSEPDNGNAAASPKRRRDRDRERAGDSQNRASRPRLPGVLGTNVHSSIAGISTSNALAQLAPPPPDARPGSKWAPWGKLTEYEMAVLRKQMKKNAVWTPSLTMVTRELERKHRTQADYVHERARCEVAGEDLLDEEPETLQQIMTASGLGQLAPHGPAAERPAMEGDVKGEESGPVSIRLKPAEAEQGRKMDRFSQRQQAMRDAQELVDATEKIKEAANGLKELTFGSRAVAISPSQNKRAAAHLANKRKRNTSSPPADEEADRAPSREASVASQDSAMQPPEPKRLKLQFNVPAPDDDADVDADANADDDDVLSDTLPAVPTASIPSTPTKARCHASVTASPSPLSSPLPSSSPATVTSSKVPARVATPPPANTAPATTSVQIPLAPAGPSTPKVSRSATKQQSRHSTPAAELPSASRGSSATAVASPATEPTPEPEPEPPQVVAPPPAATAASSRPRRESAVARVATPAETAAPPMRASNAPTSARESALKSISEAAAPVLRPRSSRSHMPTPKAQSEEPKPGELGRVMRETRRHSIFSQSAMAETPQSTRMSSRRKPPPKGEVSGAEHGQKTVTNVKRAQGSKNKRRKKTEEEAEQADDIDPNEPKYCICDDVSYGAMISCDNNCDKEWFHLPCMNMTEKDIPSRRAKWYCPDCRAALNTDAYGNPLVPPPLPGRRGNRGWST